MKELAIVMPVYNEQEAIGKVLDKWVEAIDKLGIDYAIHPYNDGSKDGSLEVIKAKEKEYPGRVIAHTKNNSGHGPTILQGYREAAAAGYKWVFQIDSDDEMGPECFASLWEQRENNDFLVGIRDGRKQALPRKIISAVSRLSVRMFYGKSIWDVNTPYRLMRVSAFEDIWNIIPENTFAPNVIISGMAAYKKLRCYEIRVPQKDRQTGEVSIKKWKLFKAAVKSFWQTIMFALKKNDFFLKISFLLSTLFFCGLLNNSIFVKNKYCVTDCDVFFTIGKLFTEGVMPYRDVFDHKGPVIHFFNALGHAIGGYRGIGLLETILWIFFLIILCKIWNLLKLDKLLLGFIFLFLPILLNSQFLGFTGGNLVEEYALPFIAWGNYYLIMLCLNKKASNISNVLLGISAAVTLCLRPNMISVFLADGIALIFFCIYEKKWLSFIKAVLGGLAGMAVILLPIFLFFYRKDAIHDMLACVYYFNIEYASTQMSLFGVCLQIIYRTIYFWQVSIPCIIALYLVWSFQRNDRSYLPYFLALNVGLSVLSTLFARSLYEHYFITLLPVTIILIGILGKKINIEIKRIKYPAVACGIILYSLIFVSLTIVSRLKQPVFQPQLQEVAQLLSKDKNATNKTVVLGNRCGLYEKLNLHPDFRYIYQYPIARISAKIKNEFVNSIIHQEYEYIILPLNGQPYYVIIPLAYKKLGAEAVADKTSEEIYEAISNHYTPILKNSEYILFKKKSK